MFMGLTFLESRSDHEEFILKFGILANSTRQLMSVATHASDNGDPAFNSIDL